MERPCWGCRDNSTLLVAGACIGERTHQQRTPDLIRFFVTAGDLLRSLHPPEDASRKQTSSDFASESCNAQTCSSKNQLNHLVQLPTPAI